MTFFAASIERMQFPVPKQAPLHPENKELPAGDAESVTEVPCVYDSEQSAPQEIPVGELDTLPEPEPLNVTVSVKLGGGGGGEEGGGGGAAAVKVAVTDWAFVIGTVHEPVPVHAPPQPPNVEPLDAEAVIATLSPSMKPWAHICPHSIPAGELVTFPDPVLDTAS